jgi:hypothetical protein
MLSSFRDSYWAGRRQFAGTNVPVITDGLAMYVDAGNKTSVPSSTSTVWFDLSGNGNDLEMVAPEQVTYRTNSFYRLGPDAYFKRAVGNNIPLGDSPYCIGVFARQPFYWGNAAGLISIGTDHDPNNLDDPYTITDLRTDQSNPGRFLHSWWTDDLVAIAPRIRLNQFFFVMAQYDGLNREVYVNARLVASDIRASGKHNVVDPIIQVGSVDAFATNQEGDVAIAFIYNRSLTLPEIKTIFTSYRGRFGL